MGSSDSSDAALLIVSGRALKSSRLLPKHLSYDMYWRDGLLGNQASDGFDWKARHIRRQMPYDLCVGDGVTICYTALPQT